MIKFIKTLFFSCLTTVVFLMILILVGGILISSVFNNSGDGVEIQDQSILHIDLKSDNRIVEQAKDDPLGLLFNESRSESLSDFKNTLKYAKTDSRIEGIYLDLGSLSFGSAISDEIRRSLVDFKTSNKWVIAYGTSLSMGNYYLATAADKIYLHPEGDLEFNGLSIELLFFKNMLDKIGVKPEVFRVGEFKGAVEPFLRENASDENELQLKELLHSIYGELLSVIAAARTIPLEELKNIADSVNIHNPYDAMAYGLVDSLCYRDQVEDVLRDRLNREKEEKIQNVSYAAYKNSIDEPESDVDDEIAVLIAEGSIVPGENDENEGMGSIGSDTFIETIRGVRENDDVKAIVLRINSPGGAFIASDEMWREIQITAQKKPVIASMSNYAASGGYYMAMACDTIVAHPTTITGSIGVFSILFDLSNMLNEKLGITTQEIKTGQTGALTFLRPLNTLQKTIWQQRTDSVYSTFITKVAKTRNMTVDEVKKIASGRVWTGTQAFERGLVDKLGTYKEAIEIAAEKVRLEKYTIHYYPKHKDFITRLAEQLKRRMELHVLHNFWYIQWENLKSYQGIQARLPFIEANQSFFQEKMP